MFVCVPIANDIREKILILEVEIDVRQIGLLLNLVGAVERTYS